MTLKKSASPQQLRWRRFKRLKRGYYSFIILFTLYLLSFLLPFLVNNRAIVVKYNDKYYFPGLVNYVHDTFNLGLANIYLADEFNQTGENDDPLFGEANYRLLSSQFEEESGDNYVIMPPVPFNPIENFLSLDGNPPHSPSSIHWFGTDDSARDVFARLAYGFRISISFALMITFISYFFGIIVGAFLGFYGRWFDILGQRLVEIWGAIPFLYTVIILSAVFSPSFILLVVIMSIFSWMGITYYIRGEFYREKTKDYVSAAIVTGENNLTIMFRHILPNALTPIITFAPFAIVGSIASLVALDFLGFGLPVPTPSWGEILKQAKASLRDWHLAVFPLVAMFVTLQLIVFIGEAVREAFDPKVFSRLR